ncbi:MAG: precorrin-8X methylmutase [Eggerthellaceae bacterium]|nr:precorrin-8X methylmutase [Eggerthellaceae bacterium]
MSGLDDLVFVKPADIEHRSFEIISSELAAMGKELDPENELVIKRAIHTAADFDYADNMSFSPHATAIGVEALRSGCAVVTDTKMAASGINKRVLGKFGGEVLNFISDPDVAAEAKERGLTRSAISMERAAAWSAETGRSLVYAVGNAPTALVRIYEMMTAGEMPAPALVVGVPVGFVNVVESKELIRSLDVPYIVARGRKGGSNVAAAIVNALLYLASNDERE